MSNLTRPDESLFMTLDGMRGIGAVLVVIGHCLIFWGGLPMQIQLTPYLVDMFFVFSGFVIAYAFEPRIRRGMTVGGFMLQRVIRLYPIFLIGLVMGLCVHIIAWQDDHKSSGTIALEIVPQFLMLPSLNTNEVSIFTLNGPSWSLFFELCANLLYILIFRFLSMRVLIGVVILMAAAMVVSTYHYGEAHVGWSQAHVWGGFPRAGFGFFMGVQMFRLAGSPKAPPRRISAWACLIILTPIPVTALLVPETIKLPVQLFVALIYGPALIWLAMLVQPPRFLHKLCARAGALSYPIYMLHFPMLALFERIAWKHPDIVKHGPWIGVGLLVASIALAAAVERFYDTPVRSWIGRKLKERRRTAPPQSFVAK
ncbi:MAG: acyltransferase [Hyphomonadaceae bacterium]